MTSKLLKNCLESLRDPAVESERFRRDLKNAFFAVGHYRDMSALEVSPFHVIELALYKSTFTYLLIYTTSYGE